MPINADSDTRPPDADGQTPLQRAIRARALDAIEFQERQPKPTLQRKLLTGVLVGVVIVGFLMTVDVCIRVIHRFLLASGQAAADAQQQALPKAPQPGQPYYFSVDPPAGSASAASNSSAAHSNKSTP